MLRKGLVVLIALCAFGSFSGVFLAGLNIYTRSVTPIENEATATPALIEAPMSKQ